MNQLSLDLLETYSVNSNMIRGQILYKAGAVKEITLINGQYIEAKVGEGSKANKILIKKNGEKLEASCSCPYNSKGFCKHTVAALLAYLKKPEQTNRGRQPDIIKLFFPEPLKVIFLAYLKVVNNLYIVRRRLA